MKKLIKKLVLSLIPLSLFSFTPINAALVDLKDTERLIEIVLEGASRTMGKYADAKKVQWSWCEDTYYDSSKNLICFLSMPAINIIDKEIPRIITDELKSGWKRTTETDNAK